jgi:hypothetical protein
MAANLRASPPPALSRETSAPGTAPVASTPRMEMARLAALHDEATETALLANLLGRAPMSAGALVAAAALTAVLARDAMPAGEIVTWLVLMLAGVAAIAHVYSRAIRSPFERAPLRAFAEDMKAIALYAGFAWGAGTFLVLPAGATTPALLAFAAGGPALVAISLRTRDASLLFLAPVTALAAFSAVLRPLMGGSLASALVLIACGATAAAIVWTDSSAARARAVPRLADLSLS